MAAITKRQRRRYYLHFRVKRYNGWSVDARRRVIYKNALEASGELPRHAWQLWKEFSYAIQLHL